MKKTLSCIASFIPILGIIFGFIAMLLGMLMTETAAEILGVFLGMFSVFIIFFAVLMCWVDIFWFIYLDIKNPKLDDTMKLVWGILLYMTNIFVFPVFWFMVIRKE